MHRKLILNVISPVGSVQKFQTNTTLSLDCPGEIASPSVRPDDFSKKKRQNQMHGPRYPQYGHIPPPKRKSRKSCAWENDLPQYITMEGYRITKWQEIPMILEGLGPSEQLLPGADFEWKYWCTLNGAIAGVAKTGDNMIKWKLRNDSECGEPRQKLEHCMVQFPCQHPILWRNY